MSVRTSVYSCLFVESEILKLSASCLFIYKDFFFWVVLMYSIWNTDVCHGMYQRSTSFEVFIFRPCFSGITDVQHYINKLGQLSQIRINEWEKCRIKQTSQKCVWRLEQTFYKTHNPNLDRGTFYKPHNPNLNRGTFYKPRNLNLNRGTFYKPHNPNLNRGTFYEPHNLNLNRGTFYKPNLLFV